ncbi:hypothetical protein GCM10020295_28230 [Streptomyces cinereospinus]
MAADRHRGQPQRFEDDLGQFLAVQGPGHGPADAFVGERTPGAVEGELGVGRFERLADLVAAQRPRLPGALRRRALERRAGPPGPPGQVDAPGGGGVDLGEVHGPGGQRLGPPLARDGLEHDLGELGRLPHQRGLRTRVTSRFLRSTRCTANGPAVTLSLVRAPSLKESGVPMTSFGYSGENSDFQSA